MRYDIARMTDDIGTPKMRRPEKADRTRSRDSKHVSIARKKARRVKASR